MKFWNLNALQSLLTALLGAVPVIFAAFGCTTLATGALDCTQSTVFSPKAALIAGGVITVLKLVIIPWLQPGGLVRNLFELKVPVSQSGAPGTVFPEQIQPK